ncbi:MAG: hypothetical protein HYS23_13220 [Geobacter sp.]|nr:hypothetical protein [Geobacter sp.]
MVNEKLARILYRFEIAAKAHYAALEEMNAEEAEHQARVISQLYARIVSSGEQGRQGLFLLTLNADKAVCGMAAVYSLRYRPEEALAVLRRLSMEEDLIGFRAGFAIQRWEAGEWDID